ncbi:hypothetical protein [Streptacidiphilus rugosus]|uniref:hypothetical protein n=1 Tax=Streptacidiphilus rugosus TaxID=405783 RepID=UPI00056C6EE3|nr:hypothetical protein [Streptacidiphilus rugosus]
MRGGYQLRAEHRPANPGRAVRRWHVVPAHRLTGLCRRLTEPVAEVRPIADCWDVDLDLRCPECWAQYAVLSASLPAWADSWSPGRARRGVPSRGAGRGD